MNTPSVAAATSPNFDRAIAMLLPLEGGYVNDPDDPGGETNFGIAKRYHPDVDVKHLTREQAIAIYRSEYWDRIGGDFLPGPLALMVFDAAVNQDAGAAVLMMQEALGVPADGLIGPVTLRAAQALAESPHDVVCEVAARRAVRYATSTNLAKYGLGWFRRLMRVTAQALG